MAIPVTGAREGVGARGGAKDLVIRKAPPQIPALKGEGLGKKATRTAVKAAIEAKKVLKALVFAVGFAVIVNGIESISNHPIMAMMTVFSIAAVKYVLKGTTLENLIDRVSHGVLVFFKNTLKPESSIRPAATEKKPEELEINELILELDSSTFPPNPLTQDPQILENINSLSYVQYTVRENKELEVEILPKKRDRKSGTESDLSEKEKLKTLIVLADRYPEIRTIRLPKIDSFKSFIPLLEKFPGLENLSLTGVNLHKKELISFLDEKHLKSLELRDCLLIETDLWDKIIQKTMVSEFEDGNLNRSNDRKEMQNIFKIDLMHDVISCTNQGKNKEKLIDEFIKNLSPNKRYYPLVRFGVFLDFNWFVEAFVTTKEDSATAEKTAKRFIQVFCNVDCIVRELISPFNLDEAFFKSIAGAQIKCLKAKHVEDVAVLQNLSSLEELHFDFTGDEVEDIEGLLNNLPDSVCTIVLKRTFEEGAESEPYLTLEKEEGQSYIATVHEQGFKIINLLETLKQFEDGRDVKITIKTLELPKVGSFHAPEEPMGEEEEES